MDKPREYKARYHKVNGKTYVVVEPQVEVIKHPDGRQDVIIHAPSLELISKFVERIKKQKQEASHGIGNLQSLQS